MFPRVNSALSTYLKNSRRRTQASVAVAIAAAAGVGVASATAGAGPWASSLNSLARPGHSASGSTAPGNMAAGQAALPVKSGGSSSGGSAPGGSASGGQGGQQAGQSQSSGVELADQKKPAAPGKPAAQPKPGGQHAGSGGLAALRPLPAHPAKAQHPAAPAAPAAPKKGAAKIAAPKHQAVPPKPSVPYTIYDSVSPGAIPSDQGHVAVYGNGKFQASWSAVHGRGHVLWIDTKGNNPGCDVLDVEPGDATPSGAARWVKNRVAEQPGHLAIVYTMRSEWKQVEDAINDLPGSVKGQVRYWIADPTGVPHIVPGSSATQWYWGANFDKTSALPEFEQ